MKIAIHHRKDSFSTQWIKYCKENSIPYKIVDCYGSEIVSQLADCKALMWHHSHVDYKDNLFAKELLFSLQQAQIKVFPNFNTGWHFDDKVGQKYLLEAIYAPVVPSFVFFDEKSAKSWADDATYPKVFKLRGGAGATNVRLVNDVKECHNLINIAFRKGFRQHDPWYGLRDTIGKYRAGTATIKNILGSVKRIIKPREFERMASREKGYVYFQEFIPNNKYDIRLIVIGAKYAYGMKRMNRKNDFRASGSSEYVYDDMPLTVVETAFNTAKKLALQSVAFDFIFDDNMKPLIIEMSYGYGTTGSSKCKGYWTEDLVWHEQKFNPQGWMVDEIICEMRKDYDE